jgi:hypothetical protein
MVARTRAGVFVASAVLVATHLRCLAGDGTGSVGQDIKTVCRTIADGYRANRTSFGAFTCRFTFKWGQAATLDDAKIGKIESTVEADGLWIVDGPRTRYLLVTTSVKPRKGPEPVEQRNVREHQVTVVATPGVQESYLQNKDVRAQQSGRFIRLSPARGKEDMPHITPFSLGVMGGDATLLGRVADGRDNAHVDGTVEENGKSLLALSCGPKGRPARLIYRFDPKRGYLPVHFWNVDPDSGKRKFEASLLELKDCGSGRWIPLRGIVVSGTKDDPWPRRVREMRVTQLKLERPDENDFALDVPSGTRFFDSISRQQTVIQVATRLHESELNSVFDRDPTR